MNRNLLALILLLINSISNILWDENDLKMNYYILLFIWHNYHAVSNQDYMKPL